MTLENLDLLVFSPPYFFESSDANDFFFFFLKTNGHGMPKCPSLINHAKFLKTLLLNQSFFWVCV